MKVLIYIALILSFISCTSYEDNLQPKADFSQEEIVLHIERYCFEDGSCTGYRDRGISNLDSSEWKNEDCEINIPKIREEKHSVHITPVSTETSDRGALLKQVAFFIKLLFEGRNNPDYLGRLKVNNLFSDMPRNYEVMGNIVIDNYSYNTHIYLSSDRDSYINIKDLILSYHGQVNERHKFIFSDSNYRLILRIDDCDKIYDSAALFGWIRHADINKIKWVNVKKEKT